MRSIIVHVWSFSKEFGAHILFIFVCFEFAEEWIVKGNEIVEQMLERVPQKEDAPTKPATIVPETAP